ncbi:MAG: hypothetical protein WD871_01605 [Xanthobacteraceae bacterium]
MGGLFRHLFTASDAPRDRAGRAIDRGTRVLVLVAVLLSAANAVVWLPIVRLAWGQ